jgi:hypothetical protein
MIFNFISVGTDKVSIGKNKKMGSSTLEDLDEIKSYPNIKMNRYRDIRDVGWFFSSNSAINIVLIRDVFDKWKSGYIQELSSEVPFRWIAQNHKDFTNLFGKDNHLYNREELKSFWERMGRLDYKTFTNPDDVTIMGLNQLCFLHQYRDDFVELNWMFRRHAKFWRWNDLDPSTIDDAGLDFYITQPNMYFLELKDLSNPKFLIWLQEKDEKWKVVKEIPHSNKTTEFFWENIQLFWKEYTEGKILQDKKLVCPLYDLPDNKLVPEFEILHLMVKNQQNIVDFIRENHERYIRL